MSRASARTSFISSIANTPSTSLIGHHNAEPALGPADAPLRLKIPTARRARRLFADSQDEGQRVMRLIFEPSRLKLYIRPVGSMMKAMTGLVRLSVSIAPPAPTVTTTIDPSTPTFQP